MVGNRRREIEIIRDILEACSMGASRTKIVYSANLNFSRLDRYLGMLMDLGFVAENDGSHGSVVYGTTEAGKDFLKGCLRMQKNLGNLPAESKSRV